MANAIFAAAKARATLFGLKRQYRNTLKLSSIKYGNTGGEDGDAHTLALFLGIVLARLMDYFR
ncbi:MAG: hypothetical protein O2960_24640 [Verrucomicrobia bacterium]|nr:hypothetical protein [Verrucomicrobiota bacterium]